MKDVTITIIGTGEEEGKKFSATFTLNTATSGEISEMVKKYLESIEAPGNSARRAVELYSLYSLGVLSFEVITDPEKLMAIALNSEVDKCTFMEDITNRDYVPIGPVDMLDAIIDAANIGEFYRSPALCSLSDKLKDGIDVCDYIICFINDYSTIRDIFACTYYVHVHDEMGYMYGFQPLHERHDDWKEYEYSVTKKPKVYLITRDVHKV